MRMLDDGPLELTGAALALRPERMRTFLHAPAVIATAADQVNHFPQILSDLAGPEPPRRRIEAEFPDLPMAERPDFGAGARDADKRIVGRNGIRLIRRRPIH